MDEITEREKYYRKQERSNSKNFNSAIDNIRDRKRKKYQNKFDNFEDNQNGLRVKKIGDKNIILKRKDRKERERSRDNDNHINGRDNRDNRFRENSLRGRGSYVNKFTRGGRYQYKTQYINKNISSHWLPFWL